MNLLVLCDNSSRSANNQTNPTCAQRFSINKGDFQIISTLTWNLFLSTCLWVLVGGDIIRDNAALMEIYTALVKKP